MGSFTVHLSILFWVGFRWDGGNGSHLFLQKSVNIYVKKKMIHIGQPAQEASHDHVMSSSPPILATSDLLAILYRDPGSSYWR